MRRLLDIKSSKGNYQLEYIDDIFSVIHGKNASTTQFIIDRNIYDLYREDLSQSLADKMFILIDANEQNKNIDKMSFYSEKLLKNGIKRDHVLVAIGGGITQDITCFLSSTLFRGMVWEFVPTTLLAQADSCIGSKSSINVGDAKNLMGTFNPPCYIYIYVNFLNSLEEKDICSGIGEILKVHMIKSQKDFEYALAHYDKMKESQEVLATFIWNSLLFKKELIEVDEFDTGIRNIMNYGHSFGHAIESATDFKIPHGVAVSIGIDMANYQSYKMKKITREKFISWHNQLIHNFKKYMTIKIPLDVFLKAISKDKKNIGQDLSLILVDSASPIEKIRCANDGVFINNCKEYFKEYFLCH